MDNLHSNVREIADHHEHTEVDFGRGATSVRPLAQKTVAAPTVAGTGWYHDAAIEAARAEAIEARSNPYHH